ncbi:hypothetical protein [Novosphingobium nitrogenifigens]|nr:hypothetical protein [Novosphingobium nitrogenifigens]
MTGADWRTNRHAGSVDGMRGMVGMGCMTGGTGGLTDGRGTGMATA